MAKVIAEGVTLRRLCPECHATFEFDARETVGLCWIESDAFSDSAVHEYYVLCPKCGELVHVGQNSLDHVKVDRQPIKPFRPHASWWKRLCMYLNTVDREKVARYLRERQRCAEATHD
jgi:ribosomal protein S27AE